MRTRHQLRTAAAALAAAVLVAGCGGAERNEAAVDSARATADTADAVSGFGPTTGETLPPPLTVDTPSTDSLRRPDTTGRDSVRPPG